ncbi:hypothetical protein [Pseudomonas nicosulfuronedens]
MTMNRPNIMGKGQALHGDRTTTGALLISYLSHERQCHGRGFVLRGDKTGVCPKCGKPGVITEGAEHYTYMSIPIAVDRCVVSCGCPDGSNRIVAPLGLLSSGSRLQTATGASSNVAPPSHQESLDFSQQFLLTEKASGTPLINTRYKIITKSGKEIEGETGPDGRTRRIYTIQEEEVTIDIYENHKPIDHDWDV